MLTLIKQTLLNLYMQYELATCIYMFEPWEKKLINGFVVLIFGLIVFSSYMYLPTYIETLLRFMSPLSIEGKGSTASYSPMLQTEKINIS